jgi:guanylate kinase
LIIVVSGPGGVGKGTAVHQLVRRDPRLWLSRSWTTRERRPGEGEDSYTFVDRATFEKHIAEGGFLEHAEFLGNRYGTPWPDLDDGRDIVLEIDVQGAEQVAARQPDALLIFLTAPSQDAQEARLRARGDGEAHVAERIREAEREVAAGRRLGAKFVVNDQLDRTVDELIAIIDEARGRERSGRSGP